LARVAIYVPDDLKRRMDDVGDGINWSDVARPAFLAALAIYHHRRGPNMTTTIERLRASKAQSSKRDELQGKADGRRWAENHAEYDELRRVAEINDTEFQSGSDPIEVLYQAIDPDRELTVGEFREHCFGDERATVSDEYVEAFIEGAQELFSEIADQL